MTTRTLLALRADLHTAPEQTGKAGGDGALRRPRRQAKASGDGTNGVSRKYQVVRSARWRGRGRRSAPFLRGAVRRCALALLVLLLALADGRAADSTDAALQGRALADQLLAQNPSQNYTNSGVLHIRDGDGKRTDVPVRCEISVTSENWSVVYSASGGTGENLVVFHNGLRPNLYSLRAQNGKVTSPAGDETMVPFAASDFWIADLGQEFLHWPRQIILKKEIKRSQGCTVLESTNPHPSAGGYSRVVSWIDSDSGGFVQAFAYDASDQLLKEFYPKDVRKVKGQWQVGMMEMDNDQTGSRSRLEFNLDPGQSPQK